MIWNRTYLFGSINGVDLERDVNWEFSSQFYKLNDLIKFDDFELARLTKHYQFA